MESYATDSLQALPAPFWFIQFFKVLGFVLHAVPMNLWYAGLPIAVWLLWRGSPSGKQFGRRLALQMPIIIAFGINFGIVPLLFLQVAYSKAFYPATILMAHAWMTIIVLLIPAYYGVYLYSFGLKEDGEMTPVRRAGGWIAAGLFVVIGFLFANGLSLTTRVEGWRDLWMTHSVGGAATGTALNVSDPTLWPRWLLMFGFALLTTAAWSLVDGFWIGKKEGDDYHRWLHGFTVRLTLAGAIWATVAGAWYVVLGWSSATRSAMFLSPYVVLTIPTMVVPWAPCLILSFWRPGELDRLKATAVAGSQLGVLALNAISRQIVQNVELRALFDGGVSSQPVDTQWGSLVLFLGTFLVAIGVIAWILLQVYRAGGTSAATTEV